VWADSLGDRGDVRGEYIQLCLLEGKTPEQVAKLQAIDKKHHGKLAGPAREFLREFELGPDGLVDAARCEVDKLVEGLHEIEWLNPRLALKVTSLKDKAALAKLGTMSLERIYHVGFTWGTIGSQGGSPMSDAQLTTLAPAFRRVRHLALDCGGYLDNCFTPAGLKVLGNTVEALEYLAINYYNVARSAYPDPKRKALPSFDDYARVIASEPGFKSLKILFLRGNDTGSVNPDLLSGLPNLVCLETRPRKSSSSASAVESGWSGVYGHPGRASEIEPLKRASKN
jgi:hypothetical protein